MAIPITQVKSAFVGDAGTGGTPGSATITGTTGTGRKCTFTGTINAAGQLTAIVPIDTGAYTADPTLPQAEPVTGGSLVGATVVLAMTDKLSFSDMPSFTVATLPAASAALQGSWAYVTDAAATPVYNATAAGGGAVVIPVFCNGTNWVNR